MDTTAILISQYYAALAMLKETIVACPDELWHHEDDENKFWQVAYHALFYTHLYLQPSEEAFEPWPGHRETYRLGVQDGAAPASKATVLAYLDFCRREAAKKVPTIVLDAPSGFDWLPFSKFELQLYSIRHVQQHVGELMERLGPRASELDWIGSSYAED